MAVTDRIPLQRAVAVVTDDAVIVRPSRAQIVAPLLEAAAAAAAVAAIVAWIDRLPLLALAMLLVVALVFGPLAVLGLVYGVVGSTVAIDRSRRSARWQQGLLGLGIGTAEVVPFSRIDHVAVSGGFDGDAEDGDSGDLVQWEVQVVKDNGRRLDVGTVIVAQALAAEGLERANRLALAVAGVAGAPVRTATLAEDAPAELPGGPAAEQDEAPRRRRRRVRRGGRRPPPGV